jgi:hypothetical protein
MLTQLQKIQLQAGNHQSKLEETVQNLASGEEQLDPSKVQQVAQETAQKCSSMMQTYLGPDPDSSEAIEFLCLAEGGVNKIAPKVQRALVLQVVVRLGHMKLACQIYYLRISEWKTRKIKMEMIC